MDCAVTGEGHVIGVNIELSPPNRRASNDVRAASKRGGGVGEPGVIDYIVNVKGFASAEVALRPGDLYVFGANRLHQVSPVKGPLARVTLGSFISFDRDMKDVLVWA
mmetsp:Transcript_46152/g.73947  ORF Transcript_46152/g.73947 Transcript_46152/m.73947 type:complete len:107 (+) Transcript_46152:1665-1985(+)